MMMCRALRVVLICESSSSSRLVSTALCSSGSGKLSLVGNSKFMAVPSLRHCVAISRSITSALGQHRLLCACLHPLRFTVGPRGLNVPCHRARGRNCKRTQPQPRLKSQGRKLIVGFERQLIRSCDEFLERFAAQDYRLHPGETGCGFEISELDGSWERYKTHRA